jgi:AcrR family transcriptional regulator
MERATRERLLDALLVELGEKGYSEMVLADVLRSCEVSMTTFEAEFVDMDASLFAAYEQLLEGLRRKAIEGCTAGNGDWPQQVRFGLRALLGELAANPRLAQVLTRSFPSISAEARSRYQRFVEELALLLSDGREYAAMGEALPAEVEMLAVGAAEAIVFEEIEAGRTTDLLSLCPAILFSLLVPFLGPRAASVEMETARQAD